MILWDKKDWRECFQGSQGTECFYIRNHPGWASQQPDSTKCGGPSIPNSTMPVVMNGIEVANGREYYPEALQWAA